MTGFDILCELPSVSVCTVCVISWPVEDFPYYATGLDFPVQT